MNDSGLMAASVAHHSGLHWGVVTVFAVVYLGMFLGGLPRLKLDRAGVALLGAIAVIGPGRSAESALKTLMRWIKQCQPLMQALGGIGYNVRRHRFLRQEVEQIVRHLGEP
jgi:anaerobic C4-dicarboxylate transporter